MLASRPVNDIHWLSYALLLVGCLGLGTISACAALEDDGLGHSAEPVSRSIGTAHCNNCVQVESYTTRVWLSRAPEPIDVGCRPRQCGPAPGAPNVLCDDGSVGGPVCERTADGTCGWTFRECPGDGEMCGDDECPVPAPGAPNFLCDDGSTGGPICERGADGACQWTFRECPETRDECGADECPTPAPGAPNVLCDDGSVGGPVCERTADGTCGWTFRDCP